MSYCSYTKNLLENDIHKIYHDKFYGFHLNSDNELFGRLILEINQAGLSWDTILKKQDNFRKAYDNFDIELIANYDETKINCLLADSGIIRNKLKINAIINNAKILLEMQKSISFDNWLKSLSLRNLTNNQIVIIFRKFGFKFVGGEILNEFLMSTGYIDGAHDIDCEIYRLTM